MHVLIKSLLTINSNSTNLYYENSEFFNFLVLKIFQLSPKKYYFNKHYNHVYL